MKEKLMHFNVNGKLRLQLRGAVTVLAAHTNSSWFHSSHIYHIVLRFAVSDHHSDAVLDQAGPLGGREHMVHGELDGPARLQQKNTNKTNSLQWLT